MSNKLKRSKERELILCQSLYSAYQALSANPGGSRHAFVQLLQAGSGALALVLAYLYTFDLIALSAPCLQVVQACSALPLALFQDSQRTSLLSLNDLLKCWLNWSKLSLLTKPGLP